MSLSAKQVTAGYRKDVPILRSLSIQATKGKVTAIIGPNGAGKSTLFKVICGFLHPISGSIYIDNQDVTNKEPAQLRMMGVAYLPQNRCIFPKLTVMENLEMGVVERP